MTASFDNLHIDSYDANFRPQHRRLHSGSSLNWNNKMLVMSETIPDELLESEGVVPTKKASASRLACFYMFCFIEFVIHECIIIQIIF